MNRAKQTEAELSHLFSHYALHFFCCYSDRHIQIHYCIHLNRISQRTIQYKQVVKINHQLWPTPPTTPTPRAGTQNLLLPSFSLSASPSTLYYAASNAQTSATTGAITFLPTILAATMKNLISESSIQLGDHKQRAHPSTSTLLQKMARVRHKKTSPHIPWPTTGSMMDSTKSPHPATYHQIGLSFTDTSNQIGEAVCLKPRHWYSLPHHSPGCDNC